MSLEREDHLTECVWLACCLEAMARKPGNVHPEAAFDDLAFQDFALSAELVAPVLAKAESSGVGQAVLAAIEATRTRVAGNTNLGIVLLLAPLAAVPRRQSLREGMGDVLSHLTRADAGAVYRAIRLAQPGGLGTVESQDVTREPDVTLLEAMQMAAERDAVAAQYANGFSDVLEFGLPLLAATGDFEERWEETVIELHLRLMARIPDTLIARKCGIETANESAARAREILDAGWSSSNEGRLKFQQFDGWLRADGHRRNPGTTADLVAACLFAGFRERTFDAAAMSRLCRPQLCREQPI